MATWSSMSFREKSAWASFATLLIVSAAYFWNLLRILFWHAGRSAVDVFGILLVVFVVAQAVLHVALRLQSPGDARTPKDERERLIGLKSTEVAFVVLIVGSLASIGTMHLRVRAWEMAHTTLFAVVLAALAKFASQIVFYRRDA